MAVDLDRLRAQLLVSKIQGTNPPLFQVINQLIQNAKDLQDALEAIIAGSGGGGGGAVINNIYQQFLSLGSDDGGGGDGEVGPPGIAGADGANGMVPYYIAPSETFTIPEFKQALFAMNIDNEGIIVADGFLIEVD